jgi:hypothetical protein
MLQFLVTFVTERSLRNSVGSTVTDYILLVLTPANIIWSIIPDGEPKIYNKSLTFIPIIIFLDNKLSTLGVLFVSCLVMGFISKRYSGRTTTLSKKMKQALLDTNTFIKQVIIPKRVSTMDFILN